MRLIDACALQEEYKARHSGKRLLLIDVAPTVDAVPVVRCRECKHNPKLEWFGCPMAGLSAKQRPETAWCWKGERKDGEQA